MNKSNFQALFDLLSFRKPSKTVQSNEDVEQLLNSERLTRQLHKDSGLDQSSGKNDKIFDIFYGGWFTTTI